jgi:hypothetical protein
MDEFLSPPQLRCLEKAIANARVARGVQREPTPDGEALAYQYADQIHWAVNGGPHNTNVARGTVPLRNS